MTVLDHIAPPGCVSRRVTQAAVYLDRIAANMSAIRGLIRPETQIMAVVKANAYGHGAVPVARTALAAGASHLGVACVDEGLALRAASIAAPIVVLGYTAPEEMAAAIGADLGIAIGTPAQAAALAAAAQALRIPARAHIKIDTGMGRFGFLPGQIDDLGRWLVRTPGMEIESCFTHMARGEDDPTLATDRQLETFHTALTTLALHGVRPRLIHAANSGATLMAPRAHFSMVRAGLLLYGYRPERSPGCHAPFQPVMEIASRLARVETLPRGARIGYGHMHELPRAGRVGLVPIGYADGLARSLSGTGYLVAGGARVPIIGRVSMDQCMVDLTDLDCAESDPVAVIGAQDSVGIWADDLAGWAGTIAYEILCGISDRIPRTYLGGVSPSAIG